ncbi:hypothetical protein [Corynebacterium wankanglinii]|uniref:Uncharacterized protein n=1 Tax=Corynebacterium wankanglinii TaxID=2735136 RepID=A0A838CL33_9CORY|nr:hypothetical protein [Corynebacterium wankanglinii]MBA1835463.1 hypothetical protein [Corynebacterium wankanglinii]
MPSRWSWGTVSGCVQRYLPRFLAVAWAVFVAATAAAYIGVVPPQLEGVDGAISVPMWLLWAAAAAALLFGSLVPSGASERARDVARWSRIIGMGIIAAELAIWTIAFFFDQPRGWVTGKNYGMLALMAMFATWTIARDRAKSGVVPHGH